MTKLTTFTYSDELYIRVIPAKSLFKSTMVHEVVNRGDIFAIRVSDSTLTIIPGTAQVEHSHHFVVNAAPIEAEQKQESKTRPPTAEELATLKRLGEETRARIQREADHFMRQEIKQRNLWPAL